VFDPRAFSPPGQVRDQEILLYRTQSGIEKTFKSIVEADYTHLSSDTLYTMLEDLDAVLKAMVHLNRARTVGQFSQVAPFLGPNDNYRGFASGSFSSWTYITGYFLSENENFKKRLLDKENRPYFDRDIDPYIKQMREESFETLEQIIIRSSTNAAEAIVKLYRCIHNKFTLFLHSHRGAIKKHASEVFNDPAPSSPEITNAESIRRAINDMHDVLVSGNSFP
jgi:hypothetical protein